MAEQSQPQRTPLYDEHLKAGGRMVDFAGWQLPVRYTYVIAEHRAVRRAAGLFDVSHMGEIRFRGPGAKAFLQYLTPNDVAKLKPGRAHYSGLLSERGTYLDDVLLYMLAEDDYLMVVNAANREQDVAWIRGHEHPDCTIEDQSDDFALLALQGPKAAAILARHTPLDLGAIRYYRFARGTVCGEEAIVSRTGYTGEDGFELYLAPPSAPVVWRTLLADGEGDGLVPAGLGARDTLRLEAGMALYGHEIDQRRTPYEAGLGWVVKLGKGDFIGRQALVEQRQRGVEERLVGFEIKGKGIARPGCRVIAGGRPVGTVASGTWSPTLERAIGTTYVPAALAEPGTALGVEVRNRLLEAAVVPLPFYHRR